MSDIFKAETLRFRGWALAYFVLNLALLGFMSRLFDLAQQPETVYRLFGVLYVASGLLLGAYQMGTYRKPNAWLNLLHRPVAPSRIAIALAGAGLVLLAAAVGLPVALIAAWQELATTRVLDARHLGLPVAAWLLASIGYLVGAYALLAGRRLAAAGFVALLVLLYSDAVGAGALAMQALLLAALAAMLLAVFRPDLDTPPRGAARTLAIAVPLHLAMWFALVLVAMGVELAWIAEGSHPNNLPVPPPGSAKEADNADARTLMALGLAASTDREAALWREQAAISDVHTLGPGVEVPQRNALGNPVAPEFDDTVRRVRWTFSHDDMRFHGRSIVDQRPVGTLGRDGGRAFAAPPVPVTGMLLASADALYQFDEESGRLLTRAVLPAGEILVGVDQAGDRIGVLSQRALYLYDTRDLGVGDGVLAPRMRVAVPGRTGNLTRIELMELVDGALVSFAYTRGRHNGYGTAFQEIVHVDADGTQRRVAHRVLASGYPWPHTYGDWYTSPVLHRVQEAIRAAFSGYVAAEDRERLPTPPAPWALALAIALASTLAAAWRLRHVDLPYATRGAWLVACGVLGLPALMAFALLVPRRESTADLRLPEPRTA